MWWWGYVVCMLVKFRKRLESVLCCPRVVLSECVGDVVSGGGVYGFVRGLRDCCLVEVFDGVFANPVLCGSVCGRACVFGRVLSYRLVVCVSSACWVWGGRNFTGKLVVNHDSITCVTGRLCMTDHVLFGEDVVDVCGVLVTSPERTVVDVVRYYGRQFIDEVLFIKGLSGVYGFSQERLLGCLERMRPFIDYDGIVKILCEYGFITNTNT